MKQPSQYSAAAEHEQRERKRVTADSGGGGSRQIEGGSEEEGGGAGDFEGGSEEEGGGEIQIQEGRQSCSSSSPVARATMVMSPAARLSAAMRSPATPIALVSTPNEALVLQEVGPLLLQYHSENSTQSELKVRILTGKVTEKHRMALEVVALNVGFPRGAVEHVAAEDKGILLGIADLVIYGSCLDEQSFPSVLVQAMSLNKLVIAPDLGMIRKYIDTEQLLAHLVEAEMIKRTLLGVQGPLAKHT